MNHERIHDNSIRLYKACRSKKHLGSQDFGRHDVLGGQKAVDFRRAAFPWSSSAQAPQVFDAAQVLQVGRQASRAVGDVGAILDLEEL